MLHHTPLPLPDIVMPTERFNHVMMPGLINPRSEEAIHGIIPQLVRSLDHAVAVSPIEVLKHRLPNYTNGAMPSFHGPLMQLSGKSVALRDTKHAGETEQEVKAESAVKGRLAKEQSEQSAKKEKKTLGKRNLSIKEHGRSGLD